MTINHLTYIMIMTMTSFSALTARGQNDTYRFDLGVKCGMSGYSGDLCSNFFKHPGINAGVKVDYLFNSRYSAGANLSISTLSGKTADGTFLPQSAPRQFKSVVYELDCRFNFNFMPYGKSVVAYRRLYNWTPYITAGVGVIASHSGSATSVSPVIPIGAGVRYRVADRLNLAAEFIVSKTFTDRLDNVDDPLNIDSAFAKNTDWMSGLTIALSYEIGARCTTCHHID
ncbi:MAG: porin family protein [Muribaculaceae bacterium]|nr:porin family protein [Muribaculaceae bacterium]